MTYDELLVLVKCADGKALRTVTDKKFRVGTYLISAAFTPLSAEQGKSNRRVKCKERAMKEAIFTA